MAVTKVFLAIFVSVASLGQTSPERAREQAEVPKTQADKQSVAAASATSASALKAVPPRTYAGDDVCRSCHQEKTEAYLHTAHHLTSQSADAHSIAGNFGSGTDTLKTSNPELYFKMEANDRGYFQTAVKGIAPYTTSHSERFDIVIGSGRKGQTYLFWKGDQLFQLPVSYWIELGAWANSPGYPDGVADFNRRVIPRCLECHATSFESRPPPENRFSKTGFVLGLACEKCHGPGRDHVALYSSKSAAPSQTGIVNPARLPRDRQIELCAWCHAGQGQLVASAFSYLPGEPLDHYLELPRPSAAAQVDVHGSQVELLERSRCFQSSTMTCSTCHDVHVGQHDLAAFSKRCLTCHKAASCGVYAKLGNSIASKCIDCHMPNQPTSLIVSEWNGKKVMPKVRNHWIKVYPEPAVETKD